MKKQRLTDRMTFRQTPYDGKVAGIYVRVSREATVMKEGGKIDERESIKAQREGCIEYAKARGWGFKLYDGDSELSGYEGAEVRHSLQALIADIEAGKIHTVICRESKRLFRNNYLLQGFVAEVLKPHGVDLQAYAEPIDIKTGEGILMLNIKGHTSEEELRYSATRSMASKKGLAKAGELIDRPPFGYVLTKTGKERKMIVRPDEADIVKRVFELFLSGRSARAVAKLFNSEGLKTQQKNRFRGATVMRILQNQNYIGKIRHEGEYYPAPYPVLIDPATFQQVQSKIAGMVRHTSPRPENLLTGLLHCGYCVERGTRIHTMQVTSIPKRQGNYRIYKCSTKIIDGASACPEGVSVGLETLETFITELVLKHVTVQDLEKMSALAPKPGRKQLEKQLSELDKRIARIRANRARVVEAISTGETDFEPEQLRKMEANIGELQRQSDTIQGELLDATKEAALQALTMKDQWANLDIYAKKKLLSDIIETILVYDDRLAIRFKVCPAVSVPFRFERVGSGRKRVPQYPDTTPSLAEIVSMYEDAPEAVKRERLQREALNLIREIKEDLKKG